MRKGTVYLVGAGPGDPDLITKRGSFCIEKADVIVYDRLVNPQLLALAPPGAELIYAGKSPSGHIMTQDEINALLVRKAREGMRVVRLKGGDPFIFGRGGEEAEVLFENGISFEIVPGVTSAFSAPAYAGIPVTHRAHNAALTIVTGNEDPAKNESGLDWDHIANGAGTLVFLMGMSNLSLIARKLLEAGRSSETPVALIYRGTTADQRTLTGTLTDISERAKKEKITNPSVIVVGDVVKLRKKLNWFERKPLFGKRVLVTRTREQAGKLSAAVRELGGEPLEFNTIGIEEPADCTRLDRSLRALAEYRYLIFTSANGVKFFFRRMAELSIDIRELKGVEICAIGPATEAAVKERGLLVSFTPSKYVAEEITEVLCPHLKAGDRILLPRADIARDTLPKMLDALGCKVDEVVAYRTRPGNGEVTLVKALLAQGRLHVVTFTSSSTVRNFNRIMGDGEDIAGLLKSTVVASIGPVTSQTARELGIKVDIEAKEYTINGLVEAIVSYYKI